MLIWDPSTQEGAMSGPTTGGEDAEMKGEDAEMNSENAETIRRRARGERGDFLFGFVWRFLNSAVSASSAFKRFSPRPPARSAFSIIDLASACRAAPLQTAARARAGQDAGRAGARTSAALCCESVRAAAPPG